MITFTITKYEDNTFRIETKHMHYHYQDGLHSDNISAKDLPQVMSDITYIANNEYKEGAVFEVNF